MPILHRYERVVIAVVIAVVASAGAVAAARAAYPGVRPAPLFATPGKAAYCTIEPTNQEDESPKLFCWTPNDGFGVQINWRESRAQTYYFTKPPEIVHGTSVLKSYAPRAHVLGFGHNFLYGCVFPKSGKACERGENLAAAGRRASVICNQPARVARASSLIAPSRCTVLPVTSSFAQGANLAQLRWSNWGKAVATARGYELGFHLPLAHIPVTVRADALRRNRCGGGFIYTRLRLTSASGTSVVHPQSCVVRTRILFRCASHASGLTCRNATDHGFWLGRYRGYRLF